MKLWRPAYLPIWVGARKKKTRTSRAMKYLAPHPIQNSVSAPDFYYWGRGVGLAGAYGMVYLSAERADPTTGDNGR